MTAPPPPPHQAYPPPPPQQTPAGYGAPPPPWLSETRPRPVRPSPALGVVALVLGVVALAISWVPWVNLLGLLLALGGLVVGVFAAVRRPGVARGLGIGGAAASLLALAVVLVLLAVSAVGFVRDRVQDAAGPSAASEPEVGAPSERTDRPQDVSVEKDEQMELGGDVGVVTSIRAGVTWDVPADRDAGQPPTGAVVEHTLVLENADGSPMSLMSGEDVEASMATEDGVLLEPGACSGSDDDVVSERTSSSTTGALTRRDCYALPMGFDGGVVLRIATPLEPGSPDHLVDADVSIPDIASRAP